MLRPPFFFCCGLYPGFLDLAKTVWPYVEGGRLKPTMDQAFPLAEAAAAHARMEAGDHVGKIVLTMDE